MSETISLRDREIRWPEGKCTDGTPEGEAVREKLVRRHSRLPVQIPGQVSLEDYPEVFSDGA